MVTLKSLAADLGVSHTLVSRVLNNRMGTTSRVGEKTRQAILARAKELNYTPNAVALALRNKRTGVVGVFSHGFGVSGTGLSEEFTIKTGQMLSGLGLRLWIEYFETRDEFLKACGDDLLQKVDGLIVSGLSHPELAGQLVKMRKRGLPIAASWETSSLPSGIPNFQVENELQTYLPAKHLIEKGCRRIAHFQTGEKRYQGYRRALEEAGIPVLKELCLTTPHFTLEEGRKTMARLLKSGTRIDGICAQSDAQAAGALLELVHAGVPRECWPKITGVDDSPIAREYSVLPLTSTTAERAACAELTVQALAKMIEGEEVEGQTLDPKMIIRESSM